MTDEPAEVPKEDEDPQEDEAEGEEAQDWSMEPPPTAAARVGTKLLIAGALGFLVNTLGWLMVVFDVIGEYPYPYVGMACFALYFIGRFLRWRGRRA
jgi:hypothetical protein